MRIKKILLLFLGLSFMFSACSSVPEPKPFGPLPSESQIAWHEMEMYGFIHFSMNTFTDIEWGYGDVDAKVFNPTELDCRQWAKVCKDAGMKGIIITAKHHDGFCLWPSKYTDYSVKNSPWRDGKGDLVRELADACKEYDLKLGVYLSPWDRNCAFYGKPEYITYFRNQLTELLTEYGDIFEVWFDGANGGDGYYGGARETRKIDNKTYYDWETTYDLVRKHQPNAILFSDAGPGCRWVGNEAGWAGETNWSFLRKADVWPGYLAYQELSYGHADGTHWIPAEVDVSIRPGWFYHKSEDHKVRTLETMVDIYYNSIGRNGTLLLNFPVDHRGLINELDVARLEEMTAVIKSDFEENMIYEETPEVSSVRDDSRKYSAKKLTDGDKDSYWTTDDGVTTGSIIINLDKDGEEFNRLLIQEYIRLGQRVEKFSVEAMVNGQWVELDNQTTIGYKRILRLPTTKATKVRVNILQSRAEPVISNLELYNAPKLLIAPTITRNQQGVVNIHNADNEVDIFYTTDGTAPTISSTLYKKPFQTDGKVEIKAVAISSQDGKRSSMAGEQYDVIKADWKVVGESSSDVNKMFDGDYSSAWFKHAKLPTDLIIDMGKVHKIKGFKYLPDQDRWFKGIIFKYNFSVSKDGKKWTKVSGGEFSNINNSPIMQTKMFDVQSARYLKFQALEGTVAGDVASFAEVDVITE